MPKGYSANQAGAIACLFGSAMWGLVAHAYARLIGQEHWIYSIFIVLFFILIPLYFKLYRPALIVGMFSLATAMGYLALLTGLLGTVSWFTFSRGLYDFTYLIWYLISIMCIYFSYRTCNEVGNIENVKVVYTFNQTASVGFWVAGCMLSLTLHAIARMLGLASILYTMFIIIILILIPFLFRLYSHAFIAAIFLWIGAMSYLFITPTLLGTAPWYLLSRGLYDFTHILIIIFGFAFIYFAYKSYTELITKS